MRIPDDWRDKTENTERGLHPWKDHLKSQEEQWRERVISEGGLPFEEQEKEVNKYRRAVVLDLKPSSSSSTSRAITYVRIQQPLCSAHVRASARSNSRGFTRASDRELQRWATRVVTAAA